MKIKNNESIVERDVILVYINNNPTFFARIEAISPDVKKGWWRVKLLILNIPLIVTTWILDNEQIRGDDFTMGGTPVRIEKVIAPETPSESKPVKEQDQKAHETSQRQARIISINPNAGTKK